MCFFDQSLPKGGGAQRPVQGLVTRSGGQPWGGSRNTKNEDLTPEAVSRYPKGEEGEPCRH